MKFKEMIKKHLVKQMFAIPTDTSIDRYYISASCPITYYRTRWSIVNGRLTIATDTITEAEYTEAYWIYDDMLKSDYKFNLLDGDSMDVQQYNYLMLKVIEFMNNDYRKQMHQQQEH